MSHIEKPAAIDIFFFVRRYGARLAPLMVYRYVEGGGSVFYVDMECPSKPGFLEAVLAKGKAMAEQEPTQENA